MNDDFHRLLTRRELDVLDCLRHGKTMREIADDLHIDYETVRSHKKVKSKKFCKCLSDVFVYL